MVRVICHSLGSDGSTLFRSAAGDFFLSRSGDGRWFLEREVKSRFGVFVYAGHAFFNSRLGALCAIERAILQGGAL